MLQAEPRVREVLDTFTVLATLPPECMGAYCISMARAASDVLAVRLLQVKCGVAHPMRIAPLFETREDLQNAPGVMQRVLSVAAYKGVIGASAPPPALRHVGHGLAGMGWSPTPTLHGPEGRAAVCRLPDCMAAVAHALPHCALVWWRPCARHRRRIP